MRLQALAVVVAVFAACAEEREQTGESAPASHAASSSSSTEASSSGGTSLSGTAPVEDPNLDGPLPLVEPSEVESVAVLETDAATGLTVNGKVDVKVFQPRDATGSRPLVVINHGFQSPIGQYEKYARRLATHGFVAMLVDYQAGFIGANHIRNALEIRGAIQWALNNPTLRVDGERIGITGHSLGGKLAFHVAVMDARIKAVLGLDPVDAAKGCSQQDCPDVTDMVHALSIPTAVLGETTDAAGGFQACAPEDANFETFFAQLKSPALKVTVNGANHLSFMDDVAGCGMSCTFCKPATVDNQTVNQLAQAYVVAFFRKHLRGEAAFDLYLTGAEAQARYVGPGLVSVEQK